MSLDHPSLARPRSRLALLATLTVLVVLSVVLVASVTDAALIAAAGGGDGPLLAPFRWVPMAANLA